MFNLFTQKLRSKSNPKHFDKIRIEYGEILSQPDCDAVLFFMLPNLKWGGSLNKAVLDMAGEGLDACVLDTAITPKSGEVFMLPAFNAPYKALFMAVLADWDGGNGFEERDFLECYRKAIELAQSNGIKTISIPAMGRDKRDFPHIRFARLAVQGILDRIDERLDFVKIKCVDHTMMRTYTDQIEKMKRREA